MTQPYRLLREFFKLESASSILLIAGMVLAILAANSPLYELYHDLLHIQITVTVADYGLDKPLHYWINDGLMALFFLVIGIEMKRELVEGELSSLGQASMPVAGAIGGVLLPALIYSYFNWGDAYAMKGWAVPCATDIAFTLGILSLFGKRVPLGLKVFLTAVAVIDDLMAILIIAVFYSHDLSLGSLSVAGVCIALLVLLGRMGCRHIAVYLLVGFVMWFAVLKSGVHATLAGVVLGMLIPHRITNEEGHKLSENLLHKLHPYVAFIILPIFSFANTGIRFWEMEPAAITGPIAAGVALGLFFGKQLGIFSFTWLFIKAGFGRLPKHATWTQLYAVGLLGGIGFTMSLFINSLAFADPYVVNQGRLGIIVGSIASSVVGYFWLRYLLRGVPASGARE